MCRAAPCRVVPCCAFPDLDEVVKGGGGEAGEEGEDAEAERERQRQEAQEEVSFFVRQVGVGWPVPLVVAVCRSLKCALIA